MGITHHPGVGLGLRKLEHDSSAARICSRRGADRGRWLRNRRRSRRIPCGPAIARSELSLHLAAIRSAHSIVLASLAVVMASGVMLAASDTDTFLHAPLFWLKMALVGLLNREWRVHAAAH